MIKKIFLYFLIAILIAVVQTTIFHTFAFLGTVPNLLLTLTVSVGLLRGIPEGIMAGAMAGLLADIAGGGLVGFNALLFMYIGLICGWLSKSFVWGSPKIALVVSLAAETVYLGIKIAMSTSWQIALPELAYTAVVCIPMFVLTRKCTGRRNSK